MVSQISALHDQVEARAGRTSGTSLGSGGVRHLMQRPCSPEQLLFGTAALGEYSFVLSDELSPVRPRHTGCGSHALRFVTEATQSVVHLVALSRLRFAVGRLPVLTQAAVRITDVEAWHAGGRPAPVVMDLTLTRLGTSGTPSGLKCTATVSVGGVLCAQSRAHFGSPAPAPRPAGAGPLVPSDGPHGVRPLGGGRHGPLRESVLGAPRVVREHHMLMDVLPLPRDPTPDPTRPDEAGTELLVEASCQAAVLTAVEFEGFRGAYCIVTGWSGEFARPLTGGSPLRCSAVTGAVARDARDRPLLPVRVDFTQGDAYVGAVTIDVLQDC